MLPDQTLVYPRTKFLEKLDLTIARCIQNGSYLTLFILDIDNLHYFTKTYGPLAGDVIIKEIGEMFMRVFTTDALIGHYGGDEFIGAITGMKPERAFEIAEQLFLQLEKNGVSITSEGKSIQLKCTISMGMSTLPTDAIHRDSLIDKAKKALYRAKELGGNTISIYEEKDGLTGLFNYYGITQKLDHACIEARKQNSSVSIISFDIDQLMQINEQHSRLVGDEVLRRFSNILCAKFGQGNYLGRYGGDQFIVVLPNCQSDTAFLLAEEVRRQVEDSQVEFEVDGTIKQFYYRISAGIATYPMDANERVDIIRKAVEALYRAKNTGRNRVCLPVNAQMTMKANYYTQTQLERLSALAKLLGKSEAFLLREALDELLRKYNENPIFRP